MTIAVCNEYGEHEQRVALTPDVIKRLLTAGVTIAVESGAGARAGYPDELYTDSGAVIENDRKKLISEADLLLAVNAPSDDDLRLMKEGALLITFVWPSQNPDRVELLANQNVTSISLDSIPRISRAQSMDALSSMSNIAGYRAALIAAMELNRYLPMMMTAAGTIPPARFLVIGAGVAGLQAIATARRLGSVVEAYDIRPVVKEQVESLGAQFVDIPLEESDTETEGGYAKEVSERNQEIQKKTLEKHVIKSDAVITTALIPGKRAPVLITQAMVDQMKPGSVIVDIAAEQGGNCEVTRPGETIVHNGVRVAGPLHLPSSLAYHASQLFAKNLQSLLDLLIKEGEIVINMEDEIIRKATLTHEGKVLLKQE